MKGDGIDGPRVHLLTLLMFADRSGAEAELSDGDLDGAGSGRVERRSTMSSSSHAAAQTARARGAFLRDLDE